MEDNNLNLQILDDTNKERDIEELRTKLQNFKLKEKSFDSAPNSIPNIPLIKTFESDISDYVKNENLSRLDIKSREVSAGSHINNLAEEVKTKRKIFYIFVSSFIFLAIIVGSYFTYEYYRKSKIVPPLKIEVKRFFISDVWPNTNKDEALKSYTSDATSTEDYIIIDIINFEKVYSHTLKNENKFESIATSNFKYTNLGDFQDATIENIDMRVADCNEGAIIYGYVGKEKLLIANDIGKYIKTYKSLKK